MTLYLVRHARAGDRNTWEGDDSLRPLTRRGRLQAEGLLELFEGRDVQRILSSPYMRCMETVVPLASRRRLAVEPSPALEEGAPLADVLDLVGKQIDVDTVLCSHGDVLPLLLDHLAARGLDLGPEPSCAKGSTWVLETHAGEVVSARYFAPPA